MIEYNGTYLIERNTIVGQADVVEYDISTEGQTNWKYLHEWKSLGLEHSQNTSNRCKTKAKYEMEHCKGGSQAGKA